MIQKISIVLDADQVRLSHLVKLKQALAQAAGPAPVTLEFRSGERPVGRVHLSEAQGVKPSPQLQQALGEIPHLTLDQ